MFRCCDANQHLHLKVVNGSRTTRQATGLHAHHPTLSPRSAVHVTRLDQDLELPPQMQDLLSGGLGGWERDDGGLLLPLQVAQHSAQNLFRPVSGSNLSVVPGGRRGRTSKGCYSAFLSITTEVTPETEQQYACTCMHIRTHTHTRTQAHTHMHTHERHKHLFLWPMKCPAPITLKTA